MRLWIKTIRTLLNQTEMKALKLSGCLTAMIISIIIWILLILLVGCTSQKVIVPKKKDYVLTPNGWIHKNLMTSSEKKTNKEWIRSMKP